MKLRGLSGTPLFTFPWCPLRPLRYNGDRGAPHQVAKLYQVCHEMYRTERFNLRLQVSYNLSNSKFDMYIDSRMKGEGGRFVARESLMKLKLPLFSPKPTVPNLSLSISLSIYLSFSLSDELGKDSQRKRLDLESLEYQLIAELLTRLLIPRHFRLRSKTFQSQSL